MFAYKFAWAIALILLELAWQRFKKRRICFLLKLPWLGNRVRPPFRILSFTPQKNTFVAHGFWTSQTDIYSKSNNYHGCWITKMFGKITSKWMVFRCSALLGIGGRERFGTLTGHVETQVPVQVCWSSPLAAGAERLVWSCPRSPVVKVMSHNVVQSVTEYNLESIFVSKLDEDRNNSVYAQISY